MASIELACARLRASPETWLVTGVGGFIGSNLLEQLLQLGQSVVGLDNFSSGKRANLDDVRRVVGDDAWRDFLLHEGDIRSLDDCRAAVQGVDLVLHQAALGSVPRSLADPIGINGVNVGGFLNMLVAARDAGVKRFVYASSSSTYGDHPDLPRIEERIGRPLSPYAATKLANELYADVFQRSYGLDCIGLRYFNVFGERQSPEGEYAAVIPRWFASAIRGEAVEIYGDGQTSRDFCYVANVVQANVLAAIAAAPAKHRIYNIGSASRTTLLELHGTIADLVRAAGGSAAAAPVLKPFRSGDVRHTVADISRAKKELGFEPGYTVAEGLTRAAAWYLRQSSRAP